MGEWWKQMKSEEVRKSRRKSRSEHGKGNKCRDLHGSWVGKTKSLERWWEEESRKLRENKLPKSSRVHSFGKKGKTRWREWSSREKSHKSRDRFSGDLLVRETTPVTPNTHGTICYVAPEYKGEGMVNEKSDVYSFGVLMLVIISGRRPLHVMASPIMEFERENLTCWARHLARSGDMLGLVDGMLEGQYLEELVVLCITVALLCLQKSPAIRPTMGDVNQMLPMRRRIATDRTENRKPVCFRYRTPGVHNQMSYEDSMKRISEFCMVEGFWSCYCHLARASTLPNTTDFHLFNEGIRPLWEDAANRNGGKWIIRFKKLVS